MPGTRVGDPQHLEDCLHLAVLTVLPVQCNIDHIRGLAQFQDMPSEEGRALPFPRTAHCLQIRCLPVKGIDRDRGKFVKKRGGIKIPVVLKPKIHIREHRLVSAPAERAADPGTGEKGNIPFRAQAAAQNNDLQLFQK